MTATAEPLFERLLHDAGHLFHHGSHPAAANTNQGETVNLSTIAKDIEDHVKQGTEWFTQIVEQHVPAILAAAARYEQSPIVQALEGVVLPPEIEQDIAGVIKRFAALVPQPADPAATASPAQSAAATDTAGQPAGATPAQ